MSAKKQQQKLDLLLETKNFTSPLHKIDRIFFQSQS